MAIDSTTKVVLGVGVVIGIGGLLYYLLSKKGEAKIIGKVGKIGYIKRVTYNNVGGTWIHLDDEDRIKLLGKVKDGDFVVVKGTTFDGDYEVKATWTDAKGNLGAVLLDPKINYTPISFNDTTFTGKGKLIFK